MSARQYISFFVGGEEYAIDILRAREIVEHDTHTRVPKMPECIRGLRNLRGRAVPVIDLAVLLGRPPTVATRWTCILMVDAVLGGEPTLTGILIDSIGEVVDLTDADIDAPPAFGVETRLDFLTGLGKVGRKFVLLLDLDRVFASVEQVPVVTPPSADPASVAEAAPMEDAVRATPAAEATSDAACAAAPQEAL